MLSSKLLFQLVISTISIIIWFLEVDYIVLHDNYEHGSMENIIVPYKRGIHIVQLKPTSHLFTVFIKEMAFI